MSRQSYVATAGGFCMAGSSRPAAPVSTATETPKPSQAAASKVIGNKPAAALKKR
ncbi:hypothetical protein [Marinospirillum perlucidum]|uniref:hypothetical protein n=1 Tax=Marinospirillum perlucidum TaxID=1982602 RepID=UPI00138FE464|nr:hypothetical protein [Marinospirillum perlucidum]